MVHDLRTSYLFQNALALPHGLAMDLNHIGIMDDAVADGIRQSGVVQILMPAWYIHLRTKDGGCRLCSGFNQW